MHSAALRARWLPWIAAGMALAFGGWWRDCVLIAGSLLLALHAFHADMGRGAPWDGWRAAVRCWVVGVLSVLGAAGLLWMVAGVTIGGRAAPGRRLEDALLLIGLAVALAWIGGVHGERVRRHGVLAGGALVAAAGAEFMARNGIDLAACAFASGVAATMP